FGHYAYVSNEAADGLRIIDLSNLPGTVNYKDTILSGISTIHNLWIDEHGYLYFSGDGVNYGLTIFDLNVDPWNPTLVGTYATAYVHDVYVRNNLAYACEVYDGELTILNVADKSNITTLGTQTYTNAFTHNSWLDGSGNICFTTDELDYAYIYSWDVSVPSNMQQLDRIRSSLSGGVATPHNTHYFNGFLVTSYYADGLNIVDATRPSNMVEVGYFDTNPQSGGGTFGLWGAYPFLPSGLVLGTDMSEGFFVFNVNYVRAAYLEGVASDAITSNTLNNVNIEILTTTTSELTGTSGEYATGIADSGSYTIHATKYGYLPKDTTLVLAPGVVTIWNPELEPAPVVGITVKVEDAISGLPIPNAQVQASSLGNIANYMAGTNGEASDANFLQGGYELVAGKWGYVTNGLNAIIDAQNNSITIQLQPGYYDDFTFDFGWTTSATATTGLWERGNPVGTDISGTNINPEDDVTDDWGLDCFVTGNGGGTAFDDDVDGGTVVLTSPVMDLSSYNNPWVMLDWWFVSTNIFGQAGFRDSLVIEIDNGNTRKIVWSVRDLLEPFWHRDTIRITNYLQATSTVQFIIRASDVAFDQSVEAAFDKFRIEDQSTVSNQLPEQVSAGIQVFPNPSEGNFWLSYDLGDAVSGHLRIYDAKGRMVQEIAVNQATGQKLAGNELPQGIYFAVLEANGRRLATTKVLRF
ncbi:MAG TPA: choice-of-anchor B family protein, partial [Bacteroidetes bacterium]|nr:choice-of-anchor B family protein [Bacteroidota bacterium]